MTMTTDEDGGKRIAKKLKEMTFRELAWEERALAQQKITKVIPIKLERHRRIGSSFAALIFILFGLSIGLAPQHHERLVTFVWILVLFMSYYLMSIGTTALTIKGWVSPWLAMWIPNFIAGGFAAIRAWRAVRR